MMLYYFVRNGLVALLEALCVCIYSGHLHKIQILGSEQSSSLGRRHSLESMQILADNIRSLLLPIILLRQHFGSFCLLMLLMQHLKSVYRQLQHSVNATTIFQLKRFKNIFQTQRFKKK